MDFDNRITDETEAVAAALRALYDRFGYSRYRMGKFEEYDLYSRNKDFLVSEGVITFTDTNGRLMALKPDVTLSIIRNDRDGDGDVRKLYYNENVYRVSARTGVFREIPQTGLECLGAVDGYCVGEVLWLAAKSLEAAERDFVLSVSHLGVLSALADAVSPREEVRAALIRCVGEKNLHGVAAVCAEAGLAPEAAAPLEKLISVYGDPDSALGALSGEDLPAGALAGLDELRTALSVFEGTPLKEKVRVDFSAVGDRNYYNGVVFRGFVEGLPESVLSGGQYDGLMRKMGKKSRAIGFAVYMDLLERLDGKLPAFDADVMLVYGGAGSDPGLHRAVRALTDGGRTVFVTARPNEEVRCRTLYRYENGEVRTVEENA